LGSVRSVSDNTPAILESRLYAPYGDILPYGSGSVGTSQTSYGFTGEQTDNNGLVYLRARYYDPTIGAFTALDPFEGSVHNPMSLNGYSYVKGNPINLTDPSGLCDPQDGLCIKEAQRLETDFPGYFIHWDNRASNTAVATVTPCTSGVPPTATPVPTPTPTPTPRPTPTPTPIPVDQTSFPFPPKAWTMEEVQTVYKAMQMYAFALTGQKTACLIPYTGSLIFIRDNDTSGEGARTYRRITYKGAFMPTDHTIFLHQTWANQNDIDYQYWITIHEMNHTRLDVAGAYNSLARKAEEAFVRIEIPPTQVPQPQPTPTPGGDPIFAYYDEARYPTKYAFDSRGIPLVEYLVEAMTGLLWDASASAFSVNPTGARSVELHKYATGVPQAGSGMSYPTNVCHIFNKNKDITLAAWVRDNVFDGNSRLGICS
jgi:RHS repeat-associated protein